MPIAPSHRRTLLLALALSTGGVAAQQRDADAQQRFDRQQQLTGSAAGLRQAPIDPVHLRGWLDFCTRRPDTTSCEIYARRLGLRPVLGIVLDADADADAGTRIVAVTPGSPAENAGLRTGDRLLAVDATALDAATAPERLAAARARLRTLRVRQPVTLTVLRGGAAQQVRLTPVLDYGTVMLRGERRAERLVDPTPL